MKKVILLNKKEGETPLEALEVFRASNSAYKNVKMTYAGRLDPMASGLLMLLAGDAVKEKEKYLALDKEYEFEILFGFATDTHDILGKITKTGKLEFLRVSDSEKEIKKNLKFFTGKFKQKYPLYSSKTIKAARAGEKVKASTHMVEVKSLKFLSMRNVSGGKLLQNIEKRIAKVGGDFRQKEILKTWRKNLKNSNDKFLVGSFKVKCGSGMYVRQLLHDFGERIKIPSLAFRIKRVKIGRWQIPLTRNTRS